MILENKIIKISVIGIIIVVLLLPFAEINNKMDVDNSNNYSEDNGYLVSKEEFSFQIQTAYNNVKEIEKLVIKNNITEDEANYAFTVIGLSVNTLGGIYYCEGNAVKNAYIKYGEYLMSYFEDKHRMNNINKKTKLEEAFFEAYKDYIKK
ncbi:MAG: hypothetical protein RSA49_04935 [Anaerovoracaceae bacterium]